MGEDIEDVKKLKYLGAMISAERNWTETRGHSKSGGYNEEGGAVATRATEED